MNEDDKGGTRFTLTSSKKKKNKKNYIKFVLKMQLVFHSQIINCPR